MLGFGIKGAQIVCYIVPVASSFVAACAFDRPLEAFFGLIGASFVTAYKDVRLL